MRKDKIIRLMAILACAYEVEGIRDGTICPNSPISNIKGTRSRMEDKYNKIRRKFPVEHDMRHTDSDWIRIINFYALKCGEECWFINPDLED